MTSFPNLPTIDLTKLDLSKVKLPKFDLPKFDLPKVDLPRFDLPKVDISTLDDKVVGAARSALFLTVGIGVTAAEELDSRRKDATAAIGKAFDAVASTARTLVRR
jgi:hypothetical protein